MLLPFYEQKKSRMDVISGDDIARNHKHEGIGLRNI